MFIGMIFNYVIFITRFGIFVIFLCLILWIKFQVSFPLKCSQVILAQQLFSLGN